MTARLIILRGLPGSSKSTYAKQEVAKDYANIIRVNRDDIRTMLHDGHFEKGVTESTVVAVRNALIRHGLKTGKTVISDDTNLDPKVVKDLAKIAAFFEAEVKVVDFNVDVNECVARDKLRTGRAQVGEKVIAGMFKKYFKNGQFPVNPLENIVPTRFEPYVPDIFKPKAIIVDIDGTVAKMNGRSPYDYSKVMEDKPVYAVINAISNYDSGYTIIFCSGRPDSCKEDTVTWLNKHIESEYVLDNYRLFMRKTGDTRQDRIIKGEIFDEHIRHNYNVEAAFDDRDQMVEFYRNELKLHCFQCDYGDF